MALSGVHLGIQPEVLRVILTTGADFTCTLRLSEPWPVGATLQLQFDGGTTWNATITGTDAVFTETAATADGIANNKKVKLVYDGDTTQVWAVGTAVRKDG